MYGQNDCDSDDDLDVYFLTPANEYNITEKIVEANKELFGQADEDICREIKVGKRKVVSFAPNLEEYFEGTSHYDDTDEDDMEPTRVIASKDIIQVQISTERTSSKAPGACDLIAKYSSLQICNNERSNNFITNSKLQPSPKLGRERCFRIEKVLEGPEEPIINEENHVEDLTEDEIREEIRPEGNVEQANQQLQKDIVFVTNQQRRIRKQITFDCTELDESLSPINSLGSDCGEELVEIAQKDVNDANNECNEYEENAAGNSACQVMEVATNKNGEYDDDDDDKLSIIVASYLPEDFQVPCKVQYTDRKERSIFRNGKLKPQIKFNKRLSFRSRPNNTNSNSNNNTSADNTVQNHSSSSPLEINDLKLNYKTCCEHRHALQVKLPQYTGYISEYGLSREQLEEREQKMQKKQQSVLEKALKANEQEMRKMRDNDRAFTTWLKNKMRFPMNKTRNMFDANKKVRGGGGDSTTTTAVKKFIHDNGKPNGNQK